MDERLLTSSCCCWPLGYSSFFSCSWREATRLVIGSVVPSHTLLMPGTAFFLLASAQSVPLAILPQRGSGRSVNPKRSPPRPLSGLVT